MAAGGAGPSRSQDPVSQDPVGVQQDPVAWCQDPVGVQQDPVGVQQDPVGKVFKQPTYKEYTRNVFKPGQEAQCRNAAQADGLAVYQLPQDVLPELKVIAAIIYITRVYCSMIFHSVKQHKTPKKETLYTTQYATGQRLQVLLAKTVKGTLDLSLKTLSTYTAVNSQLKDEDKAKVDEHKAVLTKYFTRLLPVLRNLMDRPLNALASIINDPVNQREMIGEGEEQQMLIEPAQQAAPPQAPHTDFKPVAADQDDGLVFLSACQDFDLVAYMYSHLLMEQAAPYYKNGKPDLHSLGAVAAHAVLREGTLVKVKAGQLVLFRGNTVHAGTAGRPDSCGARLYGFAKTGQPADNTTVNVSQLGPVFEGVFQPTQGGTITSMTAEWNRRGQAGQMDPVGVQQDPVGVQQDPVVWCQDPVGQDPVVWCQDPVVSCQDPVVWCQDPDPVVWCQDPVVWCQDPVGQNPVDPVGQNPVVRNQDPVVWCQDPVVRYQDPVVPGPCAALGVAAWSGQPGAGSLERAA
ncbi:hypothetical protein V8C86DRAFT_3144600 [Haematococcus lacustris]